MRNKPPEGVEPSTLCSFDCERIESLRCEIALYKTDALTTELWRRNHFKNSAVKNLMLSSNLTIFEYYINAKVINESERSELLVQDAAASNKLLYKIPLQNPRRRRRQSCSCEIFSVDKSQFPYLPVLPQRAINANKKNFMPLQPAVDREKSLHVRRPQMQFLMQFAPQRLLQIFAVPYASANQAISKIKCVSCDQDSLCRFNYQTNSFS